MNATYKRSKYQDRNGKPYGVTAFARGHCKFQGTKVQTISTISNSEYELIGYAADETDRIGRLTDKKRSIMVTLGITENETFNICRKYNLLSPLYDIGFKRDGCWFCPNARNCEREYIREHYPELAQEVEKQITMCDYNIDLMYTRHNWVKDYMKRKKEKEQKEVYRQIELAEFGL